MIQYCLTILINATCETATVSLHLLARHGATTLFETILWLLALEDPQFANNAAWLLTHVVIDGPANWPKLFSGRLFRILAEKLLKHSDEWRE